MGKMERNICFLEFLVKKPKVYYENVFECESCERTIYDGTSSILEHLQGTRYKRLLYIFT